MAWSQRQGVLDSRAGQIINLSGLMLVILAVPALTVYETWSEQAAMRRAWNIVGPACPVVEASPTLFGAKGPKAFDYGEIRFERRFGHVSCVAPAKRGMVGGEVYRVCQFTAPAALAVTTGGRTSLYSTGVGQRATVTVRDGQVSCVLAGWFSG
jgi:hypothetical protein